MKLHKIFIGFMALAIILSFSACPNKAQTPSGTSGGSAGSGTTPTVDTTTKPDIPSGEYMASVGYRDTVFFVDEDAGKLTWVEYFNYTAYENASTAAEAKAAFGEGEDVMVYQECTTYENGAYKIVVEDQTYKFYFDGSEVSISKINETETGSFFSSERNLILVDAARKATRTRPASGTYVSETAVKIEDTDYYLYARVGDGINPGTIWIKRDESGTKTIGEFDSLEACFDTGTPPTYEFTCGSLIYSSGTTTGWVILSNSSHFAIEKDGVFSYVEMNKINE